MVKDATTSLTWADTQSPGNLVGDLPTDPDIEASTWATRLNTFHGADGVCPPHSPDCGYGGYTDWRLPSIEELSYLFKELGPPACYSGCAASFAPFHNLNPYIFNYWSSTAGPQPGDFWIWVAFVSTGEAMYPSWEIASGFPTPDGAQGALAVRGTQTAPTCAAPTNPTGAWSVMEIPPAGHGTYPTTPPIGVALNGCGQVTGAIDPYFISGEFTVQPDLFVYSPRAFNGYSSGTTDLGGAAPCSDVVGYGINALGEIVGAVCSTTDHPSPFLYEDGFIQPTTGGQASAVNSSGIVVGTLNVATPPNCPPGGTQAFSYNASTGDLRNVGSSFECSSRGLAINDAGAIAGSFNDKANNTHAFILSNTTVVDLGNLNCPNNPPYFGTSAQANGINAIGQATGSASRGCDNTSDAFLYTQGSAAIGVKCHSSTPVSPSTTAQICDLGNLGGSGGSTGNAINASGQVVGQSWLTGDSAQHAFLYSDGRIQDLNSLISRSDASLYTLVNGVAINDVGQILATGYANANPSQTISLVLTPPAAAGAPRLSIAPTSLKFPSVAAGSSSAAQTITLENSGSAAMAITGISLAGGQADDFVLTKTCGSSLATGASCTVSVIFKPVSAGTKRASIIIADNASGSPQSVALSGTGTAAGAAPVVKLSATSLTFASQAPGTSSVQAVTLTNGGTASLSLTSITLTGGQADDYELSTTCGASLSAGSSCTLSVAFKPVSAGKKLASITLADNASGSPQSITLIGTGT